MASINKTMGKYTMGVGMTEVAAGLAGLAAAYMLPGYVVKDTTTTTGKLMSIGVSLLSAVAVGYAAKSIGKNSNAGKAAVIGGLAGTSARAISTFTSFKIQGAQPSFSGVRALPMGRRIGVTDMVSPTPTRSEETVSVIQP
jgi:hypothetical protein